ncbi:hypothetical protein GOQ04_22985, partial [Emticicia sp. ODNR4P]|nr:hypothetical protein [Emticicia sp. ODNR4P]
MKRKALLPIIGAVCLATCVPKMTHAQVKIGANRTTIATNKNLEIEATNGKKVHVNKDDGRVYIEQRNSAVALTDSVAMMGADGELKHISVSRLTSLLIGYMDTDGDGIPNNTDTDDDGDGVL